jgi:hypothetical protein
MDLGLIFIFIAVGVSVFVGTQLAAIVFLIQENNRLQEDVDRNTPPF